MKIIRLLIIFTCLILFSEQIVSPQGVLPVRQRTHDWKVLSTEHFDIHYADDDIFENAREVAGYFENAFKKIENSLAYKIRDPNRIPVLLYRSFNDFLQASLGTGGLAYTEFFKRRIVLPLYPSTRFMQQVCEHELTHVFEYDAIAVQKIPSYHLLTFVAFYPYWFIEGLASYEESRGIDSSIDLWLRDRALNDRIPPLKELAFSAHLNPDEFIAGYYVGLIFHRFMYENYGAEKIQTLFHKYSACPMTMERVVLETIRKPLKEVQKEFYQWLKKHYETITKDSEAIPSTAKRLTDTKHYYRIDNFGARFSPDGKHIAFMSDLDQYGQTNLIMMNPDGANREVLLKCKVGFTIEELTGIPNWSPDSKAIVIPGLYQNRDYIYLVDITNHNVKEVKLPFDQVSGSSFSPDGKHIVFSGMRIGQSDLYTYDLNTTQITRLTQDSYDDTEPQWSPDGQKIAYVSERNAQLDLYLYDIATKESKPIFAQSSWSDKMSPFWSPDGKSIIYTSDKDHLLNAYLYRFDSRQVYRLTNLKGGVHSLAWHPNGKEIIFNYYWDGTSDFYLMPVKLDESVLVSDLTDTSRKSEYDSFLNQSIKEYSKKTYQSNFSLDLLLIDTLVYSDYQDVAVEAAFNDMAGEHWFDIYSDTSHDRGEKLVNGEIPEQYNFNNQFLYINTRYRPDLSLYFNNQITYEPENKRQRKRIFLSPTLFYPLTPYSLGMLGLIYDGHINQTKGYIDSRYSRNGFNLGFAWFNIKGYNQFDTSWGLSFFYVLNTYKKSLGTTDKQDEETFHTAQLEIGKSIYQDYIFVNDASFFLSRGPGAGEFSLDDLSGTALFENRLEFRLPIYRDMRLKPLWLFDYQEFWFIKDLRGFVYGSAAFATDESPSKPFKNLNNDFWELTTGYGIYIDMTFWDIPWRLDFSREYWKSNPDAKKDYYIGFALNIPWCEKHDKASRLADSYPGPTLWKRYQEVQRNKSLYRRD